MINTKKYIENCLYIKTKQSKLIKLKLNEPQKIVYEEIKKQAEQKKPIRLIVLKARQEGISTLIGGIIFKRTATKFNVNSAVVAHDEESTNKLFAMDKLFYERLPKSLKPSLKANNAKILEFDKTDGNGLKSQLRCMTAGSNAVGRGSTLQNLHISEFAFWSGDKNDTLAGLMQAVPNTPNTMVVIESTANGFNEFQELWQKSVNGENDFKAIFIPWYMLEEYRTKTEPLELNAEEQLLKETFKLDDEQLAWRRWCIKNNCNSDLNKFKQEYPATPQEAFISTGECYFNVNDIIEREQQLLQIQPLKKGYFAYNKTATKNGDLYITGIRFIEDNKGLIEIYQEPIKNIDYSLGADTSGEGSDRSVAQVINVRTLEQVARLSKEKITEDDYSEQLYCLGEYFNTALIGVETNFNGYVVTLLQKMGYNNLFVRETVDKMYNTMTKSYGFKTTSATRPLILSELRVIFKENKQIINSKATLDEMRTFIVNNAGRPEAMIGKHDDEVMSLAIAYGIREQARKTTFRF